MAELPDELIRDILSRLRVKKLLRFRCVSKNWRALIDSPSFVKQHLDHSIRIKSNHNLILGHLSLDCFKVLGSCNGLFCLLEYEGCGNVIIIWNSATQKYKNPPIMGTTANKSILVHGFGYDSVSDDYKLVMLHQSLIDETYYLFVSETKVYSLRSNSWRKIENDPKCFISADQGPGALACGALHWIVFRHERDYESPNSRYVVAFDLTKEDYRVITLPDNFPDNGFRHLFISELGGCLSIGCNYLGNGVDVWAMKEYGVRESWTKLLTVSDFVSNDFLPHETILAYPHRECSYALFKELLSYNVERNALTYGYSKLNRTCLPQIFHPVIFPKNLQSLVSLSGEAENGKKKQSGAKDKEATEERMI